MKINWKNYLILGTVLTLITSLYLLPEHQVFGLTEQQWGVNSASECNDAPCPAGWGTPSNVEADDTSFSQANFKWKNVAGNPMDKLKTRDMGFTFSGIVGNITVDLIGYDVKNSGCNDFDVQLIDELGNPVGVNKARASSTKWGTSEETWSYTWTFAEHGLVEADVKDVDFGFWINVEALTNFFCQPTLDSIAITVTYTADDNDVDGFYSVESGGTDCNDADGTIFPGAPELADGLDNDCDEVLPANEIDNDGDGYIESQIDSGGWDGPPSVIAGGDCNDADNTIFPGATEIIGDGIDQDCDGADTAPTDADADGFFVDFGILDCNDDDDTIFPGATEIIGDGIDQDCDGADTAPTDADADGFFGILDCNDNDATIFPGATEIIGDGIDQDCDGADTAPTDADADGFFVDFGILDCNDNDANINPGATEIPDNNVDENCDGIIESPPITDTDGDGFSPAQGDCDDNDANTYPGAPEIADTKDNDCDGVIPENERDSDGDGFRYHADGSGVGLDCNDNDPTIYPGAPEIAGDGIDQDCDGMDAPLLPVDNDADTDKFDSVASPEPVKVKIPDWIKNNAGWWAEGKIGDSDFTNGIQFMIKENIMVIPDLPEQTSETTRGVPDWVKNNAEWWANGVITENDFVSGIKYLVEQGIIKI